MVGPMKHQTIHLFQALSSSDGAPEWVHLIPSGTVSGADGRGPYTADLAAIMRDSMTSGRLVLDECHATDLAAPRGEPAPARGWIVELQQRADGIWGRVEWTETGRALMADKSYRGISPCIAVTRNGTIKRVLRASLTNDPNLPLKHLHSRSSDMDELTQIRNALALGPDATIEAILAAINAMKGEESDLMSRLIKASGADAKAVTTVAQLETHLQAARAARGTEAELRQTVVSLQSQLQTLAASAARDKAVQFVDGAIAAGKPIKPLRDHYISRHAADPKAVETEINALMSINDGGINTPPKAGDSVKALTSEQKHLCAQMGISEESYLKELQAAS